MGMVELGGNILLFLVVFLFSALTVASFIIGFRFGQSTIPVCETPAEEDEAGYVNYAPTNKYKAFIPGKDEDLED